MSPVAQFNWAAIGTLGFALLLVFLPWTMQPMWNLLFFGSPATPAWLTPEAARYVALLYAVLGAVMVGWALLLLWLGFGPLRRSEPWAWNAAGASVLGWYVLDSGMSLRWGFWQNAVLNTVFLALFAWPLLRMRRGNRLPAAGG